MLPRSAHVAVQSVCHATLVIAALYSCLRIASQLERHKQQCPFPDRSGPWRTPSSTDSVIDYCFVHIHWRACPRCPGHHSTSTPNLQLVDSAHSWLMPPSGHYLVHTPTIFLIIFQCLFSVRYIGTLPQSVDNWHITLFEVHVHVPFPFGPIGCTNKLFDFCFRIQHHIFFS